MRDPFASVRVVSITDPAVTFASTDARREYDLKRDPSGFTVREHSRPCVFVVEPASAEAALRLDAATADVLPILAFRACVRRVELPSGEVLEAKTYQSNAYGLLADEEWLKVVGPRVGLRRVQEIGLAAHRLSMLDDIDPLLQPPGQPPQS